MSLRARLTLLYTILVGGTLLVFGMVIYHLVGLTITEQIDQILEQTARSLIGTIRVNALGDLAVTAESDLDLAANVYVQLWERSQGLIYRSNNINSLNDPLDSLAQYTSQPVTRDVSINDVHLRVMSVPLSIGSRQVGALQLAASLAVVDATQQTLLKVLLIGTAIAVTIAATGVSFVTYRALAPLDSVTQTALQITRADDLSRRIPYQGPMDDEIGQLIEAFNQTLSRLENLFHTQRRFVADVGHELRTPLTVIKGNIALMRKFGCSDEESLSSIDEEADRLTRMVGDLLLLARAESGKLPLNYGLVELDTLLLEVMQQSQVLAHGKLDLRLGEIDQVLVCGDRDRLKQVLINLVSNAIKYTPVGGEVILGIGKEGDQARLTVQDNGPGIPAADLPHIFERFYRIEKSRTRSVDGKGFGLGLSIAYWIVKHHDGEITVDSIEGQGTRFCVWLPLAEGDCPPEDFPLEFE
ncbi:MAG TPA: two-component sensor histidine kinase [Chloroflexi bacterium]|nr:two-component sensor histidine kinase [Chloroflexota bacterium]